MRRYEWTNGTSKSCEDTAYDAAYREALMLKEYHGGKDRWWEYPHDPSVCLMCRNIVNTEPAVLPRWHWNSEKARQRRVAQTV